MDHDNDVGILAFVPDGWKDPWMPRHHIMSRLSRFYKVLWVSPPLHWRESLRSRPLSAKRGLDKISKDFWVYAPERYLSVNYRFEKIEKCLVKRRIEKIKSLLEEMGIRRLILYIWRPEFDSYVGKFNEELVCYHVDDEYTFSSVELPISEEESRLLKTSDVVLIHSKTLLAKKGHLNQATYYVPNGVDFSHYRKVMSDTGVHLDEFDAIPRPRVGYVGIIKHQIDLKLLSEIARKRRDWSIVLIGPVNACHDIQTEIALLQNERNVYFLGAKKPEELPAYIKHLDVCLMCYRKTDYTKFIYPMKLHEYLACGKPVVATELENLKEFSHVLSFAEGTEDWVQKIEEARDQSIGQREPERIAVARENSWDARVETIRSIFDEKLRRKARIDAEACAPA
jgi:glycosyltransferase involved in cell wall biosynthesis